MGPTRRQGGPRPRDLTGGKLHKRNITDISKTVLEPKIKVSPDSSALKYAARILIDRAHHIVTADGGNDWPTIIDPCIDVQLIVAMRAITVDEIVTQFFAADVEQG